jgi:hypothetical protein
MEVDLAGLAAAMSLVLLGLAKLLEPVAAELAFSTVMPLL